MIGGEPNQVDGLKRENALMYQQYKEQMGHLSEELRARDEELARVSNKDDTTSDRLKEELAMVKLEVREPTPVGSNGDVVD